MLRIVRFRLLIFVSLLLSVPSTSSAHDVGEPLLEQHPVWKNCCGGQDCTAQRVRIVGQEGREKVSVEIEGTQTKVDKAKLLPVPSSHTWVCYVDSNRAIINENIRCILFPEKGGTVYGPSLPSTPRPNRQSSAK